MVIKEVKQTNHAEYICKRAVTVKNKPFNNAHTRKVSELNLSVNCKQFVEKKLTKDQDIIYNKILSDDREKNERYVKRLKKKNINNQESSK